MSSITIQTSAKRIEPGASADAQLSHHACRACCIGKCGIDFGWRSNATRKPSGRSCDECSEAASELDVRLCAQHLPVRERFPQDRWAPRGAMSVQANLSTLRQQRAADRCRFGNRPEGGGNVAGTLCRRPLASVRRMSASLGAGLRQNPAPLGVRCRLLREPRESTDSLQKEPEGVVLLPTSRARSVVPQSARCTQRARNRKTQELSSIAEHVLCRFVCCQRVLLMSDARQGGYR